MPTFVLLTGAGFSRNWGAWLGDEVFEYLLGDNLSPPVRAALWTAYRRRQAFETALGQLEPIGDRRELEAAILGMFNHLQQLIGVGGLDFDQRVKNFLARFDAIFTLNFDLLLERHYLDAVETTDPRRWAGGVVPGVRPLGPSASDLQGYARRVARQVPTEASEFESDLRGNVQPYFKLHGSSNWTSTEGYLVIMGDDKAGSIEHHPILRWNSEKFRAYLGRADCRVMIIGYSLRDPHVNRAIVDAARQSGGPKLFIVDPLGVNVLAAAEPASLPSLEQAVVGSSRRSLRETLSDAGTIELGRLMRFFGV